MSTAPQTPTLTPQVPSAELVALGNLILGVINEMPNANSLEIDEVFRTRYEHLASEQWNKRIDEETLWLEAQIKRALPKRAPAGAVVPQTKTKLDWALYHVERGRHVFPCDPVTKAPLTKNGVLDASNDPIVVQAMWAKNPNSNPAISLGPSNLVVRDYDTIAAPEPATTERVQTGRVLKAGEGGGFHDYFRGSTNTHTIFVPAVDPVTEKDETDKSNKPIKVSYDALGRKVGKKGVAVGEIRSRGSYVIAPGAVHKSGKVYAIINDLPLADYPEQVPEKVYGSGPVAKAEEQSKISQYVDSAFDASGVVYKAAEKYNSGFKWLIDCPWEHQHSGGKSVATGGSSSAVMLLPSGALTYKCQHAHCEDYVWSELRSWMEESAGRKLQFGDLEAPKVYIAGVAPAKVNQFVASAEGQKVVPQVSTSEIVVEEKAANQTVAEKAKAAADIVVANLIAAENWSGKAEDIIPLFDPSVITGIYKDIVELTTRGTTLVPQFIYEYSKTLIGAKMAGKVKLNCLTAEPRRYTASIGETGSGKGAAWVRLEPVFFPQSRPVDSEDAEESTPLFSRPSGGNGLSVINSFDSFAGLKEAFFELPAGITLVCYIDEIRDFGNKGKENKNPDVVDGLVQMADSTNVSRVTTKKQGGAGGTKTKTDARLVTIMCGQDGETYMHALSGQTKVGLPDRIMPEFGVAVEGGDLHEINSEDATEVYSRIVLMDYSGTMSMSSDASEMIRVFWSGLLPEVRKKVRWRKGLILDAQLIAFGRGSKVIELEDAQNAVKIFSRQVIIRKVCFKGDAPDRMGFYSSRCKEITARIGRQLSEGVPEASAAKSDCDYERITNARRNHEEHIFVRVWQNHKQKWLKAIQVLYPDGRKFTKYIPAEEAPDSETD
jgi:hypothetical protein